MVEHRVCVYLLHSQFISCWGFMVPPDSRWVTFKSLMDLQNIRHVKLSCLLSTHRTLLYISSYIVRFKVFSDSFFSCQKKKIANWFFSISRFPSGFHHSEHVALLFIDGFARTVCFYRSVGDLSAPGRHLPVTSSFEFKRYFCKHKIVW